MPKKTIFKLPKIVWRDAITPEDEAIEEAHLLERDILARELQMIDDQCKIAAQRAKRDFIVSWLQRDMPVPLNGHRHAS